MFIRDKISIKQNKVTQFCLIDITQNWIDQMGALLPVFFFYVAPWENEFPGDCKL